ncbi:Uncharacterised protein (plasmid) [Tsukamurella tyrosinosolvens]|uniref:Uncharacterized protein n=1 Tax=Tsukamurella tyrosinosolvens TaxID=57704 RepID=A0A1H4UVP1_TSUTY|nr:hypothetical protein [Tsukamurella tyrosinosolvens]KXO98388.1 hypothetical protein AXK58_25260 [Tsukamurella tyrosinosolvens]SEC72291.1 hypothetical protein SAMN04489793_3038 [Tsukamurella tyrosinosolvens]VEH90877.1 Uncharacterised protein [Tsukamurella tyrosinosolvens]
MSKTDKTRPSHVQVHDAPAMRPNHSYACLRRGECDLPADPWSRDNFTAYCEWEPVSEPVPWRKLFSESGYRQTARRRWYRADRTAQRAIARSLTRDANSSGEIDEDVIDNRVAGPYALYGGGWWD